MFNLTLFWLLLVPVLIGAVHMILLRKNWREGLLVTGVSTLLGALLTAGVFYVSVGAQTMDVEIWNGQTTGKEREHGHYLRSYSCNCRETCTGSGQNRSCSTTCDTCYEDRYTVKWFCFTTLGTYIIDSEDSSSKRVYQKPDPQRWLSIQPGEPVAQARSYTNYVQAVPQTLFKPASEELKKKFASLIPPYPDRPYDFYRIDRFMSPGINVPDAKFWNWDIGMMLNERGPRKQVNVVVVAAKTDDPNYEYALRDAWQNGNKNDVVVILGTPNWPKIEWVRIVTWSKSEIFKVELRDTILSIGEADRTKVLPAIAQQIDKNFVRRSMKEFAYLEGEIDPPMWVLVTLVILQIIAAAVVQWFIHTHYFSGTHYRRSGVYGRSVSSLLKRKVK